MIEVALPSGRTVRGRSLRTMPDEAPDWGLHLSGRPPAPTPWPRRWVRWRDFWVPVDDADAVDAVHEAHRRAAEEQVEIACSGGIGRTGTVIAALAVLDGLPPGAAVTWARERYHPRAVETPWQRRWLDRVVSGPRRGRRDARRGRA